MTDNLNVIRENDPKEITTNVLNDEIENGNFIVRKKRSLSLDFDFESPKRHRSESIDSRRKSPSIIQSDLDILANHLKQKPDKEPQQPEIQMDRVSIVSSLKSTRRRDFNFNDNGNENCRTGEDENSLEFVRKRKGQLLYLYNRDNVLGKYSSKNFTMNDHLQEIEDEYTRIRQQIDIEKGTDNARWWLTQIIFGIEIVDKQFNPTEYNLQGWREAMDISMNYENKSDYDQVLQELYQKWAPNIDLGPEMRLLSLIAKSALLFATTKKLGSSFSNPQPHEFGNQSQQQQNQNQKFNFVLFSNMLSNQPQIDINNLIRQQQQFQQPQQQQQFQQPQQPNISDLIYQHQQQQQSKISEINEPEVREIQVSAPKQTKRKGRPPKQK